MKRLLLALIPVLFVVGCKDGPTKGDPDAETPPVTHVRRIGAAGGELVSEDGQVTVRVPAGALSEDVTLEIHRVPAASWPEEANEPQYRPVSSTVYQLLPSGQTFDEPVHIMHRVPPASLGGSAANGRYPAAQHVSRTQSGSLERHSTSTFHGRNSAAAVGSIRHFSYHWLAAPSEETFEVEFQGPGEGPVHVAVGNVMSDMEGMYISTESERLYSLEIRVNAHTLAAGPIVPVGPWQTSVVPTEDDPQFLAVYEAATGDDAAKSLSVYGEVEYAPEFGAEYGHYVSGVPSFRCVDYGQAAGYFEVRILEPAPDGPAFERNIFFAVEIVCGDNEIAEIRMPLPDTPSPRVVVSVPPGTPDTYDPLGFPSYNKIYAVFPELLDNVGSTMTLVDLTGYETALGDDPSSDPSAYRLASPPLLTAPPPEPIRIFDAAFRKMPSAADPSAEAVLATSMGLMTVTFARDPVQAESMTFNLDDAGVSGRFTSIASLDPWSTLVSTPDSLAAAGTLPDGTATFAFSSGASFTTAQVASPMNQAAKAIGAVITSTFGWVVVFLDDGTAYADVGEASLLQHDVAFIMQEGMTVEAPSAVSCVPFFGASSQYCAVLDLVDRQGGTSSKIHVFLLTETQDAPPTLEHVVTLDVEEALDPDANIVLSSDWGYSFRIYVPSSSPDASYIQFYADVASDDQPIPVFRRGTHLVENCSRSNRIGFGHYDALIFVVCPEEREVVSISWPWVDAEFPAVQVPDPWIIH